MGDFRYLLDTNSMSDLIRHPGGKVARRFAVVGEPVVCTSIVVACELRFGAAKKGSSELSIRIDQLLASFNVLPLDREADRHYAEIRAHLSRKGQPIGSNDLLIAAHSRWDRVPLRDAVAEVHRPGRDRPIAIDFVAGPSAPSVSITSGGSIDFGEINVPDPVACAVDPQGRVYVAATTRRIWHSPSCAID